MDINQFRSTILSHKTGFLLSSGDENGDCSLSVDFGSIFFDSVVMLGKNWLSFHNCRDEKQKNGKTVCSIYSIGNAGINLEDVKSIKEYDGDYLIDRFSVQAQRVFTIELEDVCGFGSWICIGLL